MNKVWLLAFPYVLCISNPVSAGQVGSSPIQIKVPESVIAEVIKYQTETSSQPVWSGDFILATEIVNVSSETQHLTTWTCSYEFMWSINRTEIKIVPSSCRSNYVKGFDLAPNTSYPQKLKLQVTSKTNDELVFSVMFRVGRNKVASNPVRLILKQKSSYP